MPPAQIVWWVSLQKAGPWPVGFGFVYSVPMHLTPFVLLCGGSQGMFSDPGATAYRLRCAGSVTLFSPFMSLSLGLGSPHPSLRSVDVR